jgi:catechol 2,3-dioxygenase-like lactoylglutathione lyase family enzyme
MPDRDGVRRIHHFGITVAQLDRSLVFYRDLLGMGIIGISDDEDVGAIVGLAGAHVRVADLDAGSGQIVELLEYRSGSEDRGSVGPDTVGSCHLSLQVADLRAVLSRLASAGFMPVGEPSELPGDGAWQGCTVVYVRDPDGVFVELVERSADG